MTLPLPYTLSADDPGDGTPLIDRVQANFDELAKAALDTGGRSLRFRAGSGTVGWPGGNAFSNTTTVTHGLGATPLAVLITGGDLTVTLNYDPLFAAKSLGASTFNVRACTVDAQLPTNVGVAAFYWVAIG